MGYNRAGERRKARLKRHRREVARLQARAEQQPEAESTAQPQGFGARVKELAQEAVGKVGEAVHAVAQKVKDAVS